MAYPYLPVNPSCTDVVINDVCGCSSVIINSGCNTNNPCSTILTASSTIIYNGPALTCTTAEPCDTLNVILQKIDEIICNLLTQINILTVQVTNVTGQITTINNNITNINNQLSVCCVTTTSTTTIHPCENFSLNNTGVTTVAVIITDCTTQEQSAIVLLPGDTNICVITDSPLIVPGTVIVTPNGPCFPPTTSTTSTSSTSSTTTTTTTAIPCECLTFYNSDDITHSFSYRNCLGEVIGANIILAKQTIKVCGSQGLADSKEVTISIGENCVDAVCPTTTTTTTVATPNITSGSVEFQAGTDLCIAENYPVTITYVAVPSPINFISMFFPTVAWSDIEYVEIVTVTPVAGFAVKYNGVVLTPGIKLYPTSALTWVNSMGITRDSFNCTDTFEQWTVKIKLYAYSTLTNIAPFNVGFIETYCPSCV